MQARHRALLELIVLIGLCIAIALVLPKALARGHPLALAVGGASFFPCLLAAGGLIGWGWLRFILGRDTSLLAGALWDLVRLMETSNRGGAANRATGRKDLLHHFAVDGAHKVGAGRPMPMGDPAALDLTKLAFELMDRNDRDGSAHGRKVGSIRRGVFVFYAIVELDKPEIAYRAMCEHMKTQQRLGEDSGVDNFTELKQLLALPAAWPSDPAQIADCESRGLPFARQLAISRSARRRRRIFHGVQYASGDAGVAPYEGPADILRQMREYLR